MEGWHLPAEFPFEDDQIPDDRPVTLRFDQWKERRGQYARLRTPCCDSPDWRRLSDGIRVDLSGVHQKKTVCYRHSDTRFKGQYYCNSCQNHCFGLEDKKTGELVCMEKDTVPE